MRRPFFPREMRDPPPLDPHAPAGPVRRGHVLLINPFYPKDPRASFGKHVLTPSLALTSIAGATPPGWTVVYHDENLLDGPPPLDPMTEVVGITVHLTFAERAYALARHYRRRGATVVLGGLHVTACPEEAATHADAIAVGEGTQVWPRILEDIRAGRLAPAYRGDWSRPWDEAPLPRRDVLPPGRFLTSGSVIATRGCHNPCGFCYLSTTGLRMPNRRLAVERVVDDIESTGEPYVVFLDNNLGADRAYLSDLCRAVRPLGIIWSTAVTIDVTDDPRVVRDMAASGCTGVFVGLETLSETNLRAARKRGPGPAEYARRVRVFADHGIHVNGSFVFGFDHDGPDVFARTVEWIEEQRLECATFHVLTPYPGTPLFCRLEAEGRILHRDWSRYDTAHVVFRPTRMSPAELARGYAWCYERLFSARSIWRRRPRYARAVLPYLAMALLYKKSNRLWRELIRRDLTAAVWRPLVAATRWRHRRFRRRLLPGAVRLPDEDRHAGLAGFDDRLLRGARPLVR